MPDPVEFYFDFSSPYAYFAAHKIDEMVEGFGRTVDWKPMMLGAAMKETGGLPLVKYPIKGDYCRADWDRLARFQELPWSMPENFPVATLAAARVFYWLWDQDPAKAKAFGWDCFTTFFGDGIDISDREKVGEIASRQGVSADDAVAATNDDVYKARVKDETEAAVSKGVFGSPFIIVDGEGFWGADRLWMVKRWLRAGGW